MKIKSTNPLIVTTSPEDILPLYVKTLGYKITHNLELGEFNLLVLEKGDSKIDFVVDADPRKFRIFSREYYAIRMNVDNIKMAIRTLEKAGCEQYTEIINVKSAKACLVSQPNGLLLALVEHKKKPVKTA